MVVTVASALFRRRPTSSPSPSILSSLLSPVSVHDFSWGTTDEPHATRRRMILEKHPEIAELFGPEVLTVPVVIALVLIQVCLCVIISYRNPSWPTLFLASWLIGGTINHSLQLAVHEISHNLAFHSPTANRLLAVFANLPTGFASAITFQKYHMDHHQYQGVDGIDTDIPVTIELNVFTNSLLKVCWVFLQPLFYAFRPILVKPKPLGMWEIINWGMSLTFNYLILHFLGAKPICYLIAGTLLGLGLHPAAGHFIAEHYEFIKGQETYSYYGSMNYLNFNVGLHNEHHDFPRVPWTRLSKIKQIAPEFYETLPSHSSYLWVFYKYITDPEIGPAARIKRRQVKAVTKSVPASVSPNGEVLMPPLEEKPPEVSPAFRLVCCVGMLVTISYVVSSAIFTD